MHVDVERLETSIRYRLRHSVRKGKDVGKEKPIKLFNIPLKDLEGLDRAEVRDELLRYIETIKELYYEIPEIERRKYTNNDEMLLFDLVEQFYLKTFKKLNM